MGKGVHARLLSGETYWNLRKERFLGAFASAIVNASFAPALLSNKPSKHESGSKKRPESPDRISRS